MNKTEASQLLATLRGRVNALAGGANGTRRGLEVKNEANATAIYLYDTIGGWDGVTAKNVVDALAQVRGDVDLHISSGGGDIFEGVAIHNAFKNHSGNVTVYVDGVAASAASFIAMAGDRIVMESNSTMMIHDGWGFCIGNASDMRASADLLDKLSDTIAQMYAKRAGGDASDWRTRMRNETWYTAQEAVDAGLADEVDGNVGASNFADLSIFNYVGAPQVAPSNMTSTDDTNPRTDDVAGSFAAFKEAIK